MVWMRLILKVSDTQVTGGGMEQVESLADDNVGELYTWI